MGVLGFNANKTKLQIKLAINRLKLVQQKKTMLNQQARREIAGLLEKNKEESARIRVEHIIREDYHIEALEIMELYCELLLARFGLLEQMKHCDPAISEAVNTIIYAAPRCEVKEVNDIRDQLIAKFGKEFAMASMENRNDVVNQRIINKLKIQTPEPMLVNQYLKAIADAFHVQWDYEHPSAEAIEMSLGIGGIGMPTAPEVDVAAPSFLRQGPSAPGGYPSTSSFHPIPAAAPAAAPPSTQPALGQVDSNYVDSMSDFEALSKRFQELKRK